MIGLNLWDEFDRVRVLDFLRQLYSQNRLLQQVLEKLSMCVECLKCLVQGFEWKQHRARACPGACGGGGREAGHWKF